MKHFISAVLLSAAAVAVTGAESASQEIITMDLIAGRKDTVRNLPSPLNGCKNAADWYDRRRKEVIREFETLMYGQIPPRPETIRFELKRKKNNVFDGRGSRREITIHLKNGRREHSVDVLWYLPEKRNGRIPVVVGLNFMGNAAATEETDIPPDTKFKPGQQAHRWQIPMLLDAGVSLIIAPRNSFFPDHKNGRKDSIFRLFHPAAKLTQTHREYTAISAWAWGYSLLLELALTEPEVDPLRIWAHGHSRLGKTALWAVANDPRFAGAVSNDSGCCGASLARDKRAETEQLAFITKTFPYWFQAKLDEYANRDADLPLDQHWLAALIAPRPLLIASATEDVWADPYNEFRCAKAVGEVYKLFGVKGLGSAGFPNPDQPVFGERVGYYLRTGKHDVTATDWKFVLEFIRQN